jgi:hypothetical protein
MVADRPFTHLGADARLEVDGFEVRLIFESRSEEQASDIADLILDKFMTGELAMAVMGPVKGTEQ